MRMEVVGGRRGCWVSTFLLLLLLICYVAMVIKQSVHLQCSVAKPLVTCVICQNLASQRLLQTPHNDSELAAFALHRFVISNATLPYIYSCLRGHSFTLIIRLCLCVCETVTARIHPVTKHQLNAITRDKYKLMDGALQDIPLISIVNDIGEIRQLKNAHLWRAHLSD